MICPICNKELNPTDAFCPTCGYEIHIYPEGSDAFEALEKTRVNKYKEFWKAVDESKTTIQNLESECKDLKDTLSNMQEELNKMTVQAKDLSTHLSSAQYEISQLNSRLEEKQKQIFQAENTISDLTQQRDDYKEQLSRMTKEKDVVDTQYRKLFEQMSSMQYEISNMKSELQIQTEEKERLESLLSKQQTNQKSTSNPSGSTTSTNANRGERKGEVEFFNGHSKVREDIFLGKNSYIVPQSMHSHLKGEVFMINENNNGFTIFDCCGLLKKANGRGVLNKGEQLFEGENVFTISNIIVKVILPEIDLKNINF